MSHWLSAQQLRQNIPLSHYFTYINPTSQLLRWSSHTLITLLSVWNNLRGQGGLFFMPPCLRNNPTLWQFNSDTEATIKSPHGHCNRGDVLFNTKHGQAVLPLSCRASSITNNLAERQTACSQIKKRDMNSVISLSSIKVWRPTSCFSSGLS